MSDENTKKLVFTVDLQGYNDGYFEDAVIEKAAEVLAGRVQKDLKSFVRDHLNTLIVERADKVVGEMLAELARDGIPETNHYGERKGTHTLKELFLQRVTNDRFSSYMDNELRKIANHELEDELKAIRSEVREKWSNKVRKAVLEEVKKVAKDMPI
jgi:SpoVK/Ycf46/Vps4 family AAA+-type ATPase